MLAVLLYFPLWPVSERLVPEYVYVFVPEYVIRSVTLLCEGFEFALFARVEHLREVRARFLMRLSATVATFGQQMIETIDQSGILLF